MRSKLVLVLASAAAATAFVCLPSAAHAIYVGTSLGGGADVGGQLASSYDAGGTLTGRKLALGFRLGPAALEGTFMNAGLDSASGVDSSAYSLGADLKLFLPVGLGFELYGKGGLARAWIVEGSVMEGADLGGTGYGYGAGLQFAFRKLPLLDAGVWLDVSRQTYGLSGDGQDVDAHIDTVLLGVSIGTGI